MDSPDEADQPTTFSIKASPSSFEKRRSITGDVWLQLDDVAFPLERWSDFPVVIVGWWLQGVEQVLSGRSKRCKCFFMDGPHWFEISVRTMDRWLIQCMQNSSRGDQCLLEGICSSGSVISEIMSAANVVKNICHEKGWQTADVDTLLLARANLQATIKAQR